MSGDEEDRGMNRIGLRLEDKNEWERRVALIPEDVRRLTAQGIAIDVQRFARRAYPDAQYRDTGARIVDSLCDSDFILGIKEMPVEVFEPHKAYMFFSHTIKGQDYNMDMLRALMDKKCTLLDYECVTDEQDRRLIFFGRYAGIAGMIDSLWTLGQRLEVLGCDTPFSQMRPTHTYETIDDATSALDDVGRQITQKGLPPALAPVVIGITGYGNVSTGAQEILDHLPTIELSPQELLELDLTSNPDRHHIYKVVFKEEHLFEPLEEGVSFDLEGYYEHPENYKSVFVRYLPKLTAIVNGIFWNECYPRLATAEELARLYLNPKTAKLCVVGDITCDIDGSLACTVRDTEPGDPVYIYDPLTRSAPSGFEGDGIAVMAVGNLPTELPKEASQTFSRALSPFLPAIARVDLSAPFEEAKLPAPIKKSVILWNGELTPSFAYMESFLE